MLPAIDKAVKLPALIVSRELVQFVHAYMQFVKGDTPKLSVSPHLSNLKPTACALRYSLAATTHIHTLIFFLYLVVDHHFSTF